jgi:CheY-like chemotaxis protein/HPt (histidine-containing phosphotransfer) domain-containing protein
MQETIRVMDRNEEDQDSQSKITRLKLLVVDDDEMSRRMMRLLLTREGHDVQVAANGVEAVEAVKEQQFDIVFMDLQMPIMGGVEASRAIRVWENGGMHTYIVALTASYLPEEGHLLYEAGIDNYLSKPFEVDHIQKLVGVIARAEQATAGQPPGNSDPSPSTGDVLDLKKGIQRVGGDVVTYRELLSDFIQGLPKRIETLEQLSRERDLPSLSRAAHNLKGVSSNLGALELAECAGKLDKLSNEGYTDLNQAFILELKRAGTNLQKMATDFLTNKERPVASY